MSVFIYPISNKEINKETAKDDLENIYNCLLIGYDWRMWEILTGKNIFDHMNDELLHAKYYPIIYFFWRKQAEIAKDIIDRFDSKVDEIEEVDYIGASLRCKSYVKYRDKYLKKI